MSADRFTAGKPAPQRLAKGLAVMLLTTGTLHFVVPKPFDDIIPAEIPVSPRPLTYASGGAEVAIGAGLLLPKTRRLAGALAAALFIAVYPANVNMVRLWWDKGPAARAIAIGRLPLQLPMIWAAVKVARAPR